MRRALPLAALLVLTGLPAAAQDPAGWTCRLTGECGADGCRDADPVREMTVAYSARELLMEIALEGRTLALDALIVPAARGLLASGFHDGALHAVTLFPEDDGQPIRYTIQPIDTPAVTTWAGQCTKTEGQ